MTAAASDEALAPKAAKGKPKGNPKAKPKPKPKAKPKPMPETQKAKAKAAASPDAPASTSKKLKLKLGKDSVDADGAKKIQPKLSFGVTVFGPTDAAAPPAPAAVP